MAIIAREADAVTTSVRSILQLNPPHEAVFALVQAIDAPIRYTLDGTTPTTSLGLRLLPGKKPRQILMEAFRQIKYIRESDEADLQVSYVSERDVARTGSPEDPDAGGEGQDTREGWVTEDGEIMEWIDGS